MEPQAPEFAWYCLVGLGCVSGLFAGLLGVGGGTILVPGLIVLFPYLGIAGPEATKIAMATSLALVLPTAISSAQMHAARSAIDWRMFALLCPSIIAGAFVAAAFAKTMSIQFLTGLFVLFAAYSAWGLTRSNQPSLSAGGTAHQPGLVSITIRGVIGGAVSSLLGLGVAFFSVPILTRFIAVQRAIGTAAMLCVPMAIAGTFGYLLSDTPSECREWCAGYIFLPAVAAAGIGAVLAAPLGARLTHLFPARVLRHLFACFLIFAAGHLAWKSFPVDRLQREAGRIIASIAANAQTRLPIAGDPPACLGEGSGRNIELAAEYGPRRVFVPFTEHCYSEGTVAAVVSMLGHRAAPDPEFWVLPILQGTWPVSPAVQPGSGPTIAAPPSSASAIAEVPEGKEKPKRRRPTSTRSPAGANRAKPKATAIAPKQQSGALRATVSPPVSKQDNQLGDRSAPGGDGWASGSEAR